MKTYLLAAYALIGIATFGHCLNNKSVGNSREDRSMIVMFVPFAWPLYWSWELQREAQP